MGLLDQWNKAEQSTIEIVMGAVKKGKNIEIGYRNFNGEVSTRKVSGVIVNNEFEERGYHNNHIKGFCHLRNEERTFKLERIVSARIVD